MMKTAFFVLCLIALSMASDVALKEESHLTKRQVDFVGSCTIALVDNIIGAALTTTIGFVYIVAGVLDVALGLATALASSSVTGVVGSLPSFTSISGSLAALASVISLATSIVTSATNLANTMLGSLVGELVTLSASALSTIETVGVLPSATANASCSATASIFGLL